MLRRTEGSSKEEQIYQKEQILAELQVGSNKDMIKNFAYVCSMFHDIYLSLPQFLFDWKHKYFQRVEKELQEKAAAQQLVPAQLSAAQLVPSKREAGDGGENVNNDRDRSVFWRNYSRTDK